MVLWKGDWVRSLTGCLSAVSLLGGHLKKKPLVSSYSLFFYKKINLFFFYHLQKLQHLSLKKEPWMVKKASLKIALSLLKLILQEDMEEYDSSELNSSYFVIIDLIWFLFFILVLDSTRKYLARELRRQCNRIHLLSLSFFRTTFFFVWLGTFSRNVTNFIYYLINY